MQAKIFSSLLIVGFILCLLSRVSSFNIRKLNNPNPKGQNWVVLVAGSNGYFNYRHQADICHAYKIVTDRGIPASNIITFMFDDIAFNQDNPQKGIIINEYNGTNVYPGKEAIDYRGEDVTPEVFLSVLRGETNITRGNGKTLKSGPNDRIFIYFADHGATNILAFPGFNVLHSQDLLDTLQYMYKKRMYSQLLFYVEACESGSMFNSILNANLNVYAETASTPFESSYACDYSNDVNAYLNDCYSINWMNDTDFCDVRKETIAEQFDNVLKETTTSHVCKYGDMSFEDETLIYFQGNVTTYKETKPRLKVNNPIRKPLNSRFVYEDYLIKRMTKAKLESSMPTFIKYETEYQTFLKKKARTDFIFSQLSTKFNLGTLQKYRRQFIEDMMRVNPSKTCYSDEQADLRCVKTHIQIFEKVCGKFDEYSIQFASHLKDTCLMNVKSEDLYQFLKQNC